MEKESSKRTANKQEKKLASDLGARLTPNSGATPLRKGDMELGNYLIESKATEKDSISLRRDWLEKIELQALRDRKIPVLILELKDRRYIVLREVDYSFE